MVKKRHHMLAVYSFWRVDAISKCSDKSALFALSSEMFTGNYKRHQAPLWPLCDFGAVVRVKRYLLTYLHMKINKTHVEKYTLRPVFSASRVQHISDMHSKFALRPHHMWKYGRHPICDSWD